MRVLITNTSLASWSGSELYVRDVAGGLRARGHEPLLFSPSLGPLAVQLRSDGFTVVDDLALLAEPPELIHGQHHVETVAALSYFPGVPAVFFCHGILPWPEIPPRHPRIRRYVAAGRHVAEHLALNEDIPAGDIEIIPTFVDTARFTPRGPLPPRPSRALVFSNYVTAAEPFVCAVREACGRSGISVDLVGSRFGNPTREPETLLGAYDVVFAIGRCALEAVAVGSAVVLCHSEGLGGMVTAERFAGTGCGLTGRSALTRPVSVEAIEAELRNYDPAAAAAARDLVRRERALAAALEHILAVYARAIAKFPGPPSDLEERAALHAYHRWLSPAIRRRLMQPLLKAQGERAAALRQAAGRQAAAEKEVAALSARVAEVEASISWRLGHALGRLPGAAALGRTVRRALPRLRSRPESPGRRPPPPRA